MIYQTCRLTTYRTLDASYPLSRTFYILWPAYAPLPVTCLSDRKLKERTVKPVLDSATKEIIAQKAEVTRLKVVADQHPFYKLYAPYPLLLLTGC